jgi:hypothetical protein
MCVRIPTVAERGSSPIGSYGALGAEGGCHCIPVAVVLGAAVALATKKGQKQTPSKLPYSKRKPPQISDAYRTTRPVIIA